MTILNEKAEVYAKAFSTPLEEILLENETKTIATHPHAQMHSGHVQGKFLELISRMLKPQKNTGNRHFYRL